MPHLYNVVQDPSQIYYLQPFTWRLDVYLHNNALSRGTCVLFYFADLSIRYAHLPSIICSGYEGVILRKAFIVALYERIRSERWNLKTNTY